MRLIIIQNYNKERKAIESLLLEKKPDFALDVSIEFPNYNINT